MPQSKRQRARVQPARMLNPLEALVLTRERLQEVLDDAVERGRMTRDDASEMFAELVRRGRRQTDDLIDSLVAAPADRVLREVDRAKRAAGLGRVPDRRLRRPHRRAGDRAARRADTGELRAVRDHERRNANRKTVLAAIERKLP